MKKAVKLFSKKLLMSLQKKKSGWLKDAAKTPMTLTQPLLNTLGIVSAKNAVKLSSKKLLIKRQ